MNPRALGLVWLSAVALVLVLAIGPVVAMDRDLRSQRSRVVVLGSSLTAFAVPVAGGGADSLLGDGRPHRRIAMPRMIESQLVAQLDLAIDQRADVILVEANPLFVDFADRLNSRACDGLGKAAEIAVISWRERVAEAYRWLTGLPRADIFRYDPRQAVAKQVVDPVRIRRAYPFTVREPCDGAGLRAAIERARAQGTRIVIVLPPRSPLADRLLGAERTKDLHDRALGFAARHRIEVFAPAGPWRNDEFVDLAHLNVAGRDHFLAELRRWWAQPR